MRILSIVKYDFIKLLRNKTALILMTVLPLMIMFFIGQAFGNKGESTQSSKIPVGIVNYDNSELVAVLISNFEKNENIRVLEMEEKELTQSVRNAYVEMGFIIPEGFEDKVLAGEEPQMQLLKLPTSADFGAVEGMWNEAFETLHLTDIVERYVADKVVNISDENRGIVISEFAEKLENELTKTPIISVKEIKVSGDSESNDYNGMNSSVIGIAVMFVMFSVVLGMGDMLEEKKNCTWDRLSTTPTSQTVVMLGKVIATFLSSWVQIAILMLFGQFVMGVDWGNSFVSTFLIFSVYLLCVTGLGMFLSTLVKTNAQLGAYSSILIVATSMLSGCYWPIELVPEFMQKLAILFPQYWAVKGLGNTVNANMGIGSVAVPLLVLIFMGLLFFVLTIVSGKLKYGIKRPKFKSY